MWGRICGGDERPKSTGLGSVEEPSSSRSRDRRQVLRSFEAILVLLVVEIISEANDLRDFGPKGADCQ